MGRTTTATPARRTAAEYSELPTIYGAHGVIAFARDEMGVTLTESLVRRATEARRLQVFKLSTRNVYSERGIYDWIMSLARGGNA
ncbi:hypothetical protein IU438_04775 [Nocardia cyriacigeorgica]|uniref:hypothetical protein n=1 Tax=Nocardia cyriacigeorgica TaxID=135487 RepID=UPI00189444CB|nr:hypothetical protein [Nocardia cyriacigeorgica]MBF6161357.1 hypothetical protein [Nocardia cyriacigeorgica]MBF6200218.1 hypothetical protein [Nocardia cyriacigeorgica]MBF6395097.1 hypothetical protein [Nocardia cyriacigeorgica]MBF6400730.1 hypothetical protein [Nocardia cyriacigeorgica]